MKNKITYEDVEQILDQKLSNRMKEMIKSFDLRYQSITQHKKEQYILNVLRILLGQVIESGKHRIGEWENGWSENLIEFKNTKDINSLIPKYHGKKRLAHWKQEMVDPLIENFDYKMHLCFVDAILEKYLTNDIKNLYEFGCGPAYHLIRISQNYPEIKLFGLDWTKASQLIIEQINQILEINIHGHNFDFFNPDYNIKVPQDSVFLTVAALEQIGQNYMNFVDFVIEKRPKICINIEPISEVLDENNLIDFLSVKYFEKRKYLNSYLPYLYALEKDKKIEIIDVRRTYTGSYFIEGHTLIVWRVL
jgi:hypothetical protein